MPKLKPVPFPKGAGYFKTLITFTRRWEVDGDYKILIPGVGPIVIHSGFIFDGASIPKMLRWFLSPVGILLIPGLIHDYGYRNNRFLLKRGDTYEWTMEGAGKAAFDVLFLEIANHINGLPALNILAYWAVKYFGQGAWSAHNTGD
jgi:hypothetical protein